MRKSLLVIAAVAGVFVLPTLPFLAPAADARYVAPPQPSHTTCTQLTGSLGKSRPGQNGQVFIPIYLTNTSSKSCTVTGVPRVDFNVSAISVARKSLKATRASTRDRGGTVRLKARTGTANVLLWVLPTRYWPVPECKPVRVLTARVEFGRHNIGVLVHTSFNACSGMSSTSVTGAAPRWTGL
jgi:hypothetical protein